MSQSTQLQQQQFASLLNRSCQQRSLYLKALQPFRAARNEGSSFLTTIVSTGQYPFRNIADGTIVSQQDLDMRRKAEILRYAGASTQGGIRETRAQLLSRLNRQGSSKYADFSNYITTIKTCVSNKDNVPTSTSACDVPGPPMNLIFNPNVPLYNYVGMQQDMPQNKASAPLVNDYTSQLIQTTPLTTTYAPYQITILSNPTPSSVAAITFFNSLADSKIMNCTTTFSVDMNIKYTVADSTRVKSPSNPSYDLTQVDELQIEFKDLQSIIYFMIQPQLSTLTYEDYELLRTTLDKVLLPNSPSPTSIPQTYKISNLSQTTFPNSSPYFNVNSNVSLFPPGSKITFPVTDKVKSTATPGQTDRISLNLNYILKFFEKPRGNLVTGDQVIKDANQHTNYINITNVSITFTLNVENVTFSAVDTPVA